MAVGFELKRARVTEPMGDGDDSSCETTYAPK